jgi:hypothetical protein
MIRDDADKAEEINLSELAEWNRFFAWCDYLGAMDDTYRFYAPVVQLLRGQSRQPDEKHGAWPHAERMKTGINRDGQDVQPARRMRANQWKKHCCAFTM